MAEKNLSESRSQETAKISTKFKEPSIKVRDAWINCFELVKGVEELLCVSCCSDEGLSPDACKPLHLAMEKIREKMEIMDSFFNPEKKG